MTLLSSVLNILLKNGKQLNFSTQLCSIEKTWNTWQIGWNSTTFRLMGCLSGSVLQTNDCLPTQSHAFLNGDARFQCEDLPGYHESDVWARRYYKSQADVNTLHMYKEGKQEQELEGQIPGFMSKLFNVHPRTVVGCCIVNVNDKQTCHLSGFKNIHVMWASNRMKPKYWPCR